MDEPLLPVRMLNEYTYCPRLFALEWVNGEWADNAHTVRGQTVHRRVDRPTTAPGPSPGDERAPPTRRVTLGDPELGLIATIDVLETDGGAVCPVDYKKGRTPKVEGQAWEPERVQVCAQALLLRAHGYRCDEAVLYFAGSRQRVPVPITDALVARTLALRDAARALAREQRLPPPLVDSPKCPGCSLVGICLPDEHHHLAGSGTGRVRPLVPARDDAVPLYVTLRGGKLSKRGGEIVVSDRGGEVERVRLTDTSRVVVRGAVSVTSPLLDELAKRDIPFVTESWGGWLRGIFTSASGRNVLARMAQHRAANDAEAALAVARAMVHAKIRNARVLLRRNGRELPSAVLDDLDDAARQARRATSVEALLGHEGIAARRYFGALPHMLRGRLATVFDFEGRNRRPPRDPVNALLSLAYGWLVRECVTALTTVGLDAWVGLYHRPRPGRPSLALDLMEEFRPVIADSVVITAINNDVVGPRDFWVRPTGCALKDAGRKRFIRTFEQRLDHEIAHPALGIRLSYRRVIEVQARLLAKTVLGELRDYPAFRVR